MSMITHLIVLRLTEFLTTRMIDEISDETKASIVKAYRFQDSPLDYPISISVMGGDPDNPEYTDGRIKSEDAGLHVPSGEVGGGHLWWRHGRIKVGCYFVQGDTTQEDTADFAHIVLGRALLAVDECPVNGLVDEFGEHAYTIETMADSFSEGGGPSNQYLWRGMIHWQALTERPI